MVVLYVVQAVVFICNLGFICGVSRRLFFSGHARRLICGVSVPRRLLVLLLGVTEETELSGDLEVFLGGLSQNGVRGGLRIEG